MASSPPPPLASDRAGRYEIASVTGESFWAFVPAELPPKLDIGDDLDAAMSAALHALGALDAIGSLLPNPRLFQYMFVRKEAVLSSQIEGTNATLSELLLHEQGEAPGVPNADLQETSTYIAAMNLALAELRDPTGLPISTRLLREMHRVLLSTGRGSTKQPGEIRRSQNWIGGSRPRKRDLRTAACGASRSPPVGPRAIHQPAGQPSRQGSCRSRPVRDHPPLPRRKWPHRPPVGHAHPL